MLDLLVAGQEFREVEGGTDLADALARIYSS